MELNTKYEPPAYGWGFNKLMSKFGETNTGLRLGFEYEMPLSANCFKGAAFDQIESTWDSFEIVEELEWTSDDDSFIRGIAHHPLNGEPADHSVHWFKKLGYKAHLECGGLEVDSPVFNHLGMAKGHARWLKNVIHTSGYYDASCCELWHDCGIHVHTSFLDEDLTIGAGLVADRMWNKSSSDCYKRFVCARDDNEFSSYVHQGQANGWDLRLPSSYSFGYEITDEGSDSIRINRPDGAPTAEFRMFGAESDRLLPALDIAHSTMRFIRSHVGVRKLKSMVHSIYADDFTTEDMKAITPDLCVWRDWLFEQKGYPDVKKLGNFDLIGG